MTVLVGVAVKVGVAVTVAVAVIVGVDVTVAVGVGVRVDVDVGVAAGGGGFPWRAICGLSQMALSLLFPPFADTTRMKFTVWPASPLKSRSTRKNLPSYASFQLPSVLICPLTL